LQISINDSTDDLKIEFNKLLELIYQKEAMWIKIYNESFLIDQQTQHISLPKWPIYIMLFSAIACLSMSAIFHLFTAHSKAMSLFLNRLDYAGIAILIVGSSYPPNYYLNYCNAGNFLSFLIFYFIF
jgi:adiponectin receptor